MKQDSAYTEAVRACQGRSLTVISIPLPGLYLKLPGDVVECLEQPDSFPLTLADNEALAQPPQFGQATGEI